MRRSTRGLIILAFAVATFATLRFTLGTRWVGHGHHGPHACWQSSEGSGSGTTTGN